MKNLFITSGVSLALLTLISVSHLALAGNSIGTGPAKPTQDQFFWELGSDFVEMGNFKYPVTDSKIIKDLKTTTIPQESLSQVDALVATMAGFTKAYDPAQGWVLQNDNLTIQIQPTVDPATRVKVQVWNYMEGAQMTFPEMNWSDVKTFAPGMTGLIEGR